MSEYVFGSGQMYSRPAGGGAAQRFATLQDVAIEFSGDMKELHGQYGFPRAIARGKQKVNVKAGNGDIDVRLYNSLYFGESSVSTGSYKQALDELGTVPAMSPYTVTVANSAEFYLDLGVSLADGTVLQQVASGPATGQYTVAAGVYTFNAAQEGASIILNYIYTAETGSTLQLTNKLIGTQPIFQLLVAETYNDDWFMINLNAVVCGKLTMPLKLDDFMISDLEFTVGVDQSNSLGWMSTSV